MPSAWCGVVGLKPTYGRVSRHGIFPLGVTLDHVGPMTRRVADAAAVLEVIAGHDPHDPTSLAAPVPACTAALHLGARGVRIGVDERYMGEYVHPDVVAVLWSALKVLRATARNWCRWRCPQSTRRWRHGRRSALRRPWWHTRRPSRHVPPTTGRVSARSSNTERSSAPPPTPKRIRCVWPSRGACSRFSSRWTSLLVPAPSCRHRRPARRSVRPFSPAISPFLRFTAPFNFSGNPTLSVPAGFSDDGLPYGIQLVGPLLGEAILCQVGHAYEQAAAWPRRRPPLG